MLHSLNHSLTDLAHLNPTEYDVSVQQDGQTVVPSIETIRQEIKQILLAETGLTPQDFYSDNGINHVPQKLVLQQLVDFRQTFAQETIPRFIALAHREDDSFAPITKQCLAALAADEAEFAGLIILASGSGQLANYLWHALPNALQRKFGYKIYGVDVSETMIAHSTSLLSRGHGDLPINRLYEPVMADCRYFDDMARYIEALKNDKPFLVLSHGGLRYFAPGYVHQFLLSMSAFPAGSKIFLAEVGVEMYELMHEISDTAMTMADLTTTDTNYSYISCWNLTYYYYLHQQYYSVPSLKKYINELLDASRNLIESDEIYSINTLLLNIAGQRKQMITQLELYKTNCNRREL